MRHHLLRTNAFVRDSKRMLRKKPELQQRLLELLSDLQRDPYAQRLKTHKLKGNLRHSWACSGGYDLRIVFSFTTQAGHPAVLLESIGTHDDVY